MEGEVASADDSSFETVTDENDPNLEQDLAEEEGEVESDTDESDDDGSISTQDSEEAISEALGKTTGVSRDDEDSETERIKLIEQIQKAAQERKELKKVNKTLQAKLAIFFRTKKIDMSPYDKGSAELEGDYTRFLYDIDGLEKQLSNFESDFTKEVEKYEKILKDKEKAIKELTEEFTQQKRSVALRAVDSQSGSRMTPEEIDNYLKQEEQRDKLLRDIRMEYVKHNNALKEAEKQMEELNNRPNTVNIIEFDQLGVQIQTYFMKIGQREEEIAKFQDRCSTTINILCHYKQKLHFVQHERAAVEAKLKDLEETVKHMRDQLFILKGKQESARAESHELQQKFKLLQNESLLDDYLASKQKFISLTEELDKLKKRHNTAMANIENARQAASAMKKKS